MRHKFKPNLSAPRGTSTAGSASAGASGAGGEAGGGGETKRKRQRQRSRGDDSVGTEGESSSDLETGESNVRRRQRRTSERSGSGRSHQSVVSAGNSSSQLIRESDLKRAETTTSTSTSGSASVDEPHTVAAQEDTLTLPPKPSVSLASLGDEKQLTCTSTEKDVREVETSSAGHVQSTADAELQSLGSSLTRGNSAATCTSGGGGRTAPRIKKKVAPKVVSSRPKRATPSVVVTDGSVTESSTATSQQPEVTSSSIMRKDVSKEGRDEDTTVEDDDILSSNASQVVTEGVSSLLSTNASTNQTSDEAISNTLNEIFRNSHSHEMEDSGLAGIYPSRLGLLGEVSPGDDLHGDTNILITAQDTGHTEIEVTTENADVSKKVSELRSAGQSKGATSSVTSEPLNSEESFVYQSCTDGTERTSQSPLKTGQTGQSTSTSSSQESQTSGSSRRSGSAGPRSRRSESRASSVASDVGGEAEKESPSPSPSQGSKGRKRQKRKKTPTDLNEPGSQGNSPVPKRPRPSAVKVREAPDRSTMTMQELIYYNPSANPMSSTVEERKRKKDDGQPVSGQESRCSSVQPSGGSRAGSPAVQEGKTEKGGDDQIKDDDGRIVPTLRIGVDGKIIVDESSMMMETTQQDSIEDMGEVVLESFGHTTSASYRQRCRVTRWTKEETGRFFKALSQVGTDFTMMTLLIPKRTRKELKNKFKKEERSNPHLISQALSKT